jgi:hypothetical protein
VRFFHDDGTPYGPDFQVNASTPSITERDPHIVALDSDFVIVWAEGSTVLAARPTATGSASFFEAPFTVVVTGETNPDVTVASDLDHTFAVAWTNGEVYLQRYDADGASTPIGGPVDVSTGPYYQGPNRVRSAPFAAIDAAGNTLVGFKTTFTGGTVPRQSFHSIGFDAAGVVIIDRIEVGGSAEWPGYEGSFSESPSVHMTDASLGYMLAYRLNDSIGEYVYVASINPSQSPMGAGLVMNDTTATLMFPMIAPRGGPNFPVVWQSNQSGGNEIYFKRTPFNPEPY